MSDFLSNALLIQGAVEPAEILNDEKQEMSREGGLEGKKLVLINGVIKMVPETPECSDVGAVR